jgi:magnesium chelatase family protein
MIATTLSGAVYGVDAQLVYVEVHVAPGGNGEVQVVGLPDTAVRESRARVRAAIRNSGFELPFQRITVNLAPANLRKEGSAFDLPIAIAILQAAGVVPASPAPVLLVGELALDGTLRPVRGALAIALLARRLGIPRMIVPPESGAEAAMAPPVEALPIPTLAHAVALLNGSEIVDPVSPPCGDAAGNDTHTHDDFADVRGQTHARRAVEVAIAGGHNLLMTGSPGAGKTMLARRAASIMPPMTLEERLETTCVHSVAGTGGLLLSLVDRRPFRAPHHTVSRAGLVGGGAIPRPGEVSLAHNGVLFLDELPEFPRSVLELLRQPLEERRVTIARSQMTLSFPADIVLIAAMNPCACGFLGDDRRRCRCTPRQIENYRNRISGPLLDRIDIRVHVPAVRYDDLSCPTASESSATIRERVVAARRIQRERFDGTPSRANAGMDVRQIEKHCRLDPESHRLMEHAVNKLGFSARGHARVLRLARTIADLAEKDRLDAAAVAEAIRYRGVVRE